MKIKQNCDHSEMLGNYVLMYEIKIKFISQTETAIMFNE